MKTVTFDPATHALVPLEPTEEMIEATRGPRTSEPTWEHATKRTNATVYRKMVAAAPATPAGVTATEQQEPTFWKSQRKMIERALIGLRDGWGTRKDADDALTALTTSPEVGQDDARDAARLDWLEQNHASGYRFQVSGNWRVSDVFGPQGQAPTLRAAIDAAMSTAPASEPVTAKCEVCNGDRYVPRMVDAWEEKMVPCPDCTGTAPTKAEPVTEQPAGAGAGSDDAWTMTLNTLLYSYRHCGHSAMERVKARFIVHIDATIKAREEAARQEGRAAAMLVVAEKAARANPGKLLNAISAAQAGLPDCGHGHVHKRTDGVKARCGGPGMCRLCAHDAAALAQRGGE